MTGYKFTHKATADLTEIWNFSCDKWSEDQADRYYFMLIENCHQIAINPGSGKKYSGLPENLRGFKAGSHLIFYRELSENEVEIIRILHKKMDLKNRITEKYPHKP